MTARSVTSLAALSGRVVMKNISSALLLLVTLGATLQGYYYYEAIQVLHLPPYRYPYFVSIVGSVLMVFLPLWGGRKGATLSAYILAIFSCIVGIGLCTTSLP